MEEEWSEQQEPLLLHLLSDHLSTPIDSIVDFELNLFDTQGASLGGIHSEFLHSARLDNLASCFLALKAIEEHSANLTDDEDVSMIALFDHE